MTEFEIKSLVQFMRAEGVHAFEVGGVKVQFLPRAVVQKIPGAEATQPATKNTPGPELFQGMDVSTLLGVQDAARVP